LTSCTRFHGLKPLDPRVGRPGYYPNARSLQPVLRWEASPSSPAATYDLIIYRAENAGKRVRATGTPGEQVYYREGLEQTWHKVEIPLAPDTKYLWTVRVREGQHVGEWSSYDYLYGGRIGDQYRDDRVLFRFRTPKEK